MPKISDCLRKIQGTIVAIHKKNSETIVLEPSEKIFQFGGGEQHVWKGCAKIPSIYEAIFFDQEIPMFRVDSGHYSIKLQPEKVKNNISNVEE